MTIKRLFTVATFAPLMLAVAWLVLSMLIGKVAGCATAANKIPSCTLFGVQVGEVAYNALGAGFYVFYAVGWIFFCFVARITLSQLASPYREENK